MKSAVAALLLAVTTVHGADNLVSVTRYHDQDLIPIRTKLRFTTVIVLPPGEEISEVSCGDKEYWVIDGRANILHVKPAREGAVTNLNIVLKSNAIYSFVVEEIGSKGVPDLKVVVGQDEVLRLREEKRALEQDLQRLAAVHKEELAKAEQARRIGDETHRVAIEQIEKDLPARLVTFLTKQKFSYGCFEKEICLAAVLTTETNTIVIGRLGNSPRFSGSDTKGQIHTTLDFEREGNVYKLSIPLNRVTVWYGGKSVSFDPR